MKRLFNRLVSCLLSLSIVIGILPITAFAASQTPGGAPGSTGGTGNWSDRGYFVKADFYKPSSFGLSDKSTWKYKKIGDVVVGNGSRDMQWNSLDSRALFEKAVRDTGSMDPPQYGYGERDGSAFAQLYSPTSTYKYIPVDFMLGPNYWYMYSGHTIIATQNVAGVYNGLSSASGHLISFGNPVVVDFMKLTDGGNVWDSKMSEHITTLWDKYVRPSSGIYNASAAASLRKDMAAMFYSEDAWIKSVNQWKVLFSQIKVGANVNGYKITSERQASNIMQYYLISMAYVIANPAQGLTIGGSTIGDSSYKGSALLSKLKTWANNDGNSDSNINGEHFSIRIEMYGTNIVNTTRAKMKRWDVSEHGALSNGKLSYVSIHNKMSDYITSPDHYGFNAKFSSSNAVSFYRKSAQAVLDAHKKDKLSPHLVSGNPEYYNAWAIFQIPYIDPYGNIYGSTVGYGWRGNASFESPGYFNGNRTIATGFTYISASGPIPGASGIDKVNYKMNAEIKSDNQEIPKDEKASADVYIDMVWPNQLTESEKKSQNIQVPASSWNSPSTELNSMLQLIHRIQVGGQIASGAEFSQLPVTMTITRSFENPGKKQSDKILDDMYNSTTEMIKCGKHDFKIVKDENNQAIITFNIIPSTGQCGSSHTFPKFISPVKKAQGVTGEDAYVTIDNCVVDWIMRGVYSRVKFKDTDIEITEKEGETTTVNYDIQYYVDVPTFIENINAYGTAAVDKLRQGGRKYGYGHSVKPNGTAYPYSDYKVNGSSFQTSDVIRRSLKFLRAPETPSYTNFGYEKKTPHYAEIKTGSSTNEPFEAMAGTPTTRDLYMSVSGTDFRVDFNADKNARQNPSSYRTYTYTVNVKGCTGGPTQCAGSCGSCLNPCPGHPTDKGGMSYCNGHKQHTVQHPSNHTWTYTINIPIEAFSYFDMKNSELWRLTSWGLNGGEDFLTNPSPSWEMDTKCWAFNQQDYYSGSGRIVFDASMNSNNEGDKAPWGNNTRTFEVDGSSGHSTATKDSETKVNAAKNAEKDVSGSIISDYMVLKTSEGYQAPYFFSQEFSNSVSPSSVPDFSGESGNYTVSQSLKVDKILTMDDFWYKNSNKLTCASKDNGWHNTSITYGGYNGGYSDLGSKYQNDAHDSFISKDNPLDTVLKKEKWSVDKFYPNQVSDGSGNTSFGKDAGNKDHIKTGIDVVDTTPNGEYDTGEAWVRYDRVMMYENNVDRGAKSQYKGKFDITGLGIWENTNVPYYSSANKVNNIVIHDPVAAQYAVVVSNPEQYDQRTNAELLQGGDPIGVSGGVCPIVGCQFSKLTCTTKISPHNDKCYISVTDTVVHKGGNNTHTHTAACTHKHTDACYKNSGNKYCLCSHCGNPDCYEYCGNHRYPCDPSCPIAYPQLSCGMQEMTCTNELNSHTCIDCEFTTKKTLSCSDPHHYTPGEPTDQNDPKFHYPLGDSRCWTRCGIDANHGDKTEIELPPEAGGGTASLGGVFINLDREFKIYYPFKGDFAEDPSLAGIADTTETRGHGYVNNMDTREWTDHRWVRFPVNVIDPKGEMRLAYSQIDLNEFSRDDEVFTFYCVLGNNEAAEAEVKFTSTAINAPVEDRNEYIDESTGETNKDRVDSIYAAKHTAHKFQYIDVVGYIGSLTINDTGDFRFSNLFKQAKTDDTFLIPNLVPEVHLNIPNYVVGDNTTARRDPYSVDTRWLDAYGNMFNKAGGKSGGEGYAKKPLVLPLVPRYNNIEPLRNQPMRPGYQLYMDVETVGNYYGESLGETGFLDNKMQQKMQIRPKYYSLDMRTGEYTPVDAYYGVNNEYMMVNDYDYGNVNDDSPGVQDYYYYLDWLNESARRNYTEAEKKATYSAKSYREEMNYSFAGSNGTKLRIPDAERDVIGSANVLFLNDKNRTFIGSPYTYGQYKNPGEKVDVRWFNEQSQRWHFTLGLPSSVVFVESNKPCTEANIKALQSKDRVIVSTLDIKVKGEVWTLQYDGTTINNEGFQIFENGKVFNPPDFPDDGDSTVDDPIVVIYPPDKTSKDDVISGGIQ